MAMSPSGRILTGFQDENRIPKSSEKKSQPVFLAAFLFFITFFLISSCLSC